MVFLACFSDRSRAKQKSYMNEDLTLAAGEYRLRAPGQTWLIPVRFDAPRSPTSAPNRPRCSRCRRKRTDAASSFCYPLLLPHAVDREQLAKLRLYVPTLWPELLAARGPKFGSAQYLAQRFLPLPVDQRYDASDMDELTERLETALVGAARGAQQRNSG